ncbi:hypothetical protein [Oceanobacillus kapialis]
MREHEDDLLRHSVLSEWRFFNFVWKDAARSHSIYLISYRGV